MYSLFNRCHLNQHLCYTCTHKHTHTHTYLRVLKPHEAMWRYLIERVVTFSPPTTHHHTGIACFGIVRSLSMAQTFGAVESVVKFVPSLSFFCCFCHMLHCFKAEGMLFFFWWLCCCLPQVPQQTWVWLSAWLSGIHWSKRLLGCDSVLFHQVPMAFYHSTASGRAVQARMWTDQGEQCFPWIGWGRANWTIFEKVSGDSSHTWVGQQQTWHKPTLHFFSTINFSHQLVVVMKLEHLLET